MVFIRSTENLNTGSGREVYSQNGQVNVIPVAVPMQKLLALIPQPNNGSGIYNNYISDQVQRFDTDQYDGRVDYNWSTKTHAFARYTLAITTTTHRRHSATREADRARLVFQATRLTGIRVWPWDSIIRSVPIW